LAYWINEKKFSVELKENVLSEDPIIEGKQYDVMFQNSFYRAIVETVGTEDHCDHMLSLRTHEEAQKKKEDNKQRKKVTYKPTNTEIQNGL